jgi:phosphoglycerate dehydrogenase-like enzyme
MEMSRVFVRAPLSNKDITQLNKEFPKDSFKIITPEHTLADEEWNEVDVLFGNNLSKSEFESANRLRWIHLSSPNPSGIYFDETNRSQDILVTNTKGENVNQTGEFVEAALLSFAKRLFHWQNSNSRKTPSASDNFPPWEVKGKTLLQVGLGIIGTEISRRCKTLGMRVWGVRKKPSFHPHCTRVYPLQDLPTLLRAADVVCISLPRGRQYKPWLGKEELACLKKGSILLVVGAEGTIDLAALGEITKTTPLRGILLDAAASLPKNSPLLSVPDLLVTPNIASHPRRDERLTFRTFRFNLLQFSQGNYLDMQNRIKLDDEN